MEIIQDNIDIIGRENYIVQETRNRINKFKKNITESFIELARLLDYARNSMVAGKPLYVHWGYDSFSDYCKNELNMSIEKVKILISISRFIDSSPLNDDPYEDEEDIILDEISQMGWTKADLLLHYVSDNKNFPVHILVFSAEKEEKNE